jgi:Uma2 family endonuclease
VSTIEPTSIEPVHGEPLHGEPLHGEQRMLLSSISWQTYVALVAEAQSAGKRLTYDRGELEIMSPMMPHETAKRMLARMIDRFTEIKGIEVRSSASTTFRREDLKKGFEADESYYLRSASAIRGKEQIDLAVDPPPDLVIEIEISRSAINKLELFASMGVAEVWRYDGHRLSIERLAGRRYIQSETSDLLPGFPIKIAESILQRRVAANETELIREFVDSVK